MERENVAVRTAPVQHQYLPAVRELSVLKPNSAAVGRVVCAMVACVHCVQ